MDGFPLNLAHFHERRANRFLAKHRYDDAAKALQTSLFYLQDANKNARSRESAELINTQKWEYERLIKQVALRKQQYERMKYKEIVPPTPLVLKNQVKIKVSPESASTGAGVSTGQAAAKSIDKTVQDFDAKFSRLKLSSKENQDPKTTEKEAKSSKYEELDKDINDVHISSIEDEYDSSEMISLAPLELPAFEYGFPFSVPSQLDAMSLSGLAESFQK